MCKHLTVDSLLLTLRKPRFSFSEADIAVKKTHTEKCCLVAYHKTKRFKIKVTPHYSRLNCQQIYLNHWNIDQVSFIDTQTKAEASQNTEQNLNFSPLQFESAKRALPFSFPNLDSVLQTHSQNPVKWDKQTHFETKIVSVAISRDQGTHNFVHLLHRTVRVSFPNIDAI